MNNRKITKVLLFEVLLFFVGICILNYNKFIPNHSENADVADYGADDSTDAKRLYDLAIQKNDISICKQVHLKINNIFVLFFSGVTSDELKTECINQYVKVYPESNSCSLIHDLRSGGDRVSQDISKSDYESCIYQQTLALNHKNNTSENCLNLKSESIDYCKFEFAEYKKDSKLCNAIFDNNIKSECVRYFSIP